MGECRPCLGILYSKVPFRYWLDWEPRRPHLGEDFLLKIGKNREFRTNLQNAQGNATKGHVISLNF